jgi:hypothetical protein
VFSFTLSASSVSLPIGGSVAVTITQTDSSANAVTYNMSNKYLGGWDTPSFLDQQQKVTASLPGGAQIPKITGNGTLVYTFSAAAGAVAQALLVDIYGIQQPTGDPNSAVCAQQILTLNIA